MMGWYSSGWDAGWMVLMMFGWVALLGFGAWTVAALTRPRRTAPGSLAVRESAVELLDRRLVAGDIEPEEYLAVRSALDAHSPRPGRAT